MSDGIVTSEKIGKPLSVGGIGTLLVGLCGFLPKEYQQIGILLSSFLSPLIIHLAFWIFIRVSIEPDLARYIGSLKRDLSMQRKQLKQLDPTSTYYKDMKECEGQTLLLLAKAHQDYSSGKLSLKSVTRPDMS
ncbi:MAG: hypothetical protein WCC61_18360 [Pseudomonas sp.]|jgi:hypothetical protein|uniref:hypothetical protein n=1 Tax=Pseudomonas sp. TaxID=306 RepID=UPI003C7B80EA